MMPLVWRILKGWIKKGEMTAKGKSKHHCCTEETHTNVTELLQLSWYVDLFGKIHFQLVPKVKPLVDLKSEWVWGDIQQTACLQIKHELSGCPIVAVYNPSKDTRVSAYVSSYGLGAVLTQQQEDQQWKPVAYTSRVLTPTEERHTQIEEVLGIIWACK